MWIHPINSESRGRNKLKTRNQMGIPCVSVSIGIGMSRLPPRVFPRHLGWQLTLAFHRNSIPVAGRPANRNQDMANNLLRSGYKRGRQGALGAIMPNTEKNSVPNTIKTCSNLSWRIPAS
jgi:hypothetical protein